MNFEGENHTPNDKSSYTPVHNHLTRFASKNLSNKPVEMSNTEVSKDNPIKIVTNVDNGSNVPKSSVKEGAIVRKTVPIVTKSPIVDKDLPPPQIPAKKSTNNTNADVVIEAVAKKVADKSGKSTNSTKTNGKNTGSLFYTPPGNSNKSGNRNYSGNRSYYSNNNQRASHSLNSARQNNNFNRSEGSSTSQNGFTGQKQGKAGVSEQVPVLDLTSLDKKSVDDETINKFIKLTVKAQIAQIEGNIKVLANKKVFVNQFLGIVKILKGKEQPGDAFKRVKLFVDTKHICNKPNNTVPEIINDETVVVRFEGWKGVEKNSEHRPALLDQHHKAIMDFCKYEKVISRQAVFYCIMETMVSYGYDWKRVELDSVLKDLSLDLNRLEVNTFFAWMYSEMVYVRNYNQENHIEVNPDASCEYLTKTFLRSCTLEQKVEFHLKNTSDNFEYFSDKFNGIVEEMDAKYDHLYKKLDNKIDSVFYGGTDLSTEQKNVMSTNFQVLISNVNELIVMPEKFNILSGKLDKTNDMIGKLTGEVQKISDKGSVHSIATDSSSNGVETDQTHFMNLRNVSDRNSSVINPLNFVKSTYVRIGDCAPDGSSQPTVEVDAESSHNADEGAEGPNPNSGSDDRRTFPTRIFRRPRNASPDPDEDPDPDSENNGSSFKEGKSFRLDGFKATMPKWHGVTDKSTPFEFLNDLGNYRNYLKRSDSEMIGMVIPFAMKGSAVTWYNLVKPRLKTYKDIFLKMNLNVLG